MKEAKKEIDVSVAVPVKNGSPFLVGCLDSLLNQDFEGKWEVCIYDDGSTDDTPKVIEVYEEKFIAKYIGFKSCRGELSGGVGYAKNQAVHMSSGRYICFSDADDTSSPTRIRMQYEKACNLSNKTNDVMIFIGTQFHRIPTGSTDRYTRWANDLSENKLRLQVYTSHGPTLIAPTWFISRSLFDKLGGFNQSFKTGFPEDLDFFYRSHSLADVFFHKVNDDLVVYRYHPGCASFGVSENLIWDLRLAHLRTSVVHNVTWKTFTIWSAGKQGKRFFKCLTDEEKQRVVAFCDVDERKLKHGVYEEYDEVQRRVTRRIPIIPISKAAPPLIICVKLDMTGGDLERLIEQSGWQEGTDYVLFS